MTVRYGAALTAALLVSLASAVLPARAQDRARDFEGITVQGTGRVQIKPDIARLTLGVQTDGADSAAAARENAARTQKVIDAVKAAGVADKDIQTANYSIYPRYRNNPQPVRDQTPQIIGYTVSNSVQVVVRRLGDIGKVIDGAIAGGANLASGIQFDLDDDTAARSLALERAVADATMKARVIAAAAQDVFGIQRPQVRLVGIMEGVVDMPRPMNYGMQRAMAADAMSTPIEAGEQTVTATVTARYNVIK